MSFVKRRVYKTCISPQEQK
jgi:hypothetical protein